MIIVRLVWKKGKNNGKESGDLKLIDHFYKYNFTNIPNFYGNFLILNFNHQINF
jgi:hypothetical protein